METTQEPLREPRRDEPDDLPRPHLVVLFHPDLRRVGDIARIPDPAGGIPFGRGAPLFQSPTGAATRPLGDPCSSRDVARIEWKKQRLRLRHRPGRPLTVFDADHRAVPAATELRPGWTMTVGDRLLLGLELRPSPPGPDADRMGMVGESPAMWSVRDAIERYAASRHPVVVLGESGTGKERVAEALHRRGGRSGRLVSLNCAAIRPNLMASTLFGHEAGAFTGAGEHRRGAFREADGGTLFLDEVAELDSDCQAMLLRALQERCVRPLGADHDTNVDVKVIAATNADLDARAADGSFRGDLLQRLRVHEIRIPPLRQRRFDIPTLFCHELRRECAALDAADRWFTEVSRRPPPMPLVYFRELMARPWRDQNVRGLQRCAAEAALCGVQSGTLGTPRHPSEVDEVDLGVLLAAHGYSVLALADTLGVTRMTAYKRLAQAGWRKADSVSDEAVRAAVDRLGRNPQALHEALRIFSAKALTRRLRGLGIEL